MASALNKAFNEGSELAVLIGSDVPSNSADILDTALSKLRSPDCEMILGQAKDGGYYLVGLRREVKERLGVLDGIFEGIEWSTPTVCQRQVEVAALLGVKVQLLPQILQDVNSSWIDYIEIIVSDGGSIDSTLGKVEDFAEKNPDLRIKMVRGSKGRGKQLNAGAREATGVNLLFLHADGRLPRAFDRHVLLTLAEPGTIAGAFNLGWDVLQEDQRNDCSWLVQAQLRLGQLMRLASYKFTETAFGDQGLFMSRQTFDKAGRFPPYRLMEDYEMAMNLQRHGHLKIIQDVFIIASARRLIKKGVWKVALINCLLILGYHISVHPDTLARFYYG
ncbi:uncharacterized protein LOC110974005 isoform X2 [Acanthaster planci]|uniref:Uncharacterized protein LOC110974005 isoform X2 n=1 Tax=Acanthaster planci TaxID=133434 RepID=A0A8B7XLE7_ACAPL|nr:uncharacterized protein LOC110974005 isoform X2 [Acanthaster planci]